MGLPLPRMFARRASNWTRAGLVSARTAKKALIPRPLSLVDYRREGHANMANQRLLSNETADRQHPVWNSQVVLITIQNSSHGRRAVVVRGSGLTTPPPTLSLQAGRESTPSPFV